MKISCCPLKKIKHLTTFHQHKTDQINPTASVAQQW